MEKIKTMGTPGTFQTSGNETRSMAPEITGGALKSILKNKEAEKKDRTPKK